MAASNAPRDLVVLVGQSTSVREQAVEKFRSAGYEVRLCPTAAAALDELGGTSVRGVVSEYDLPDGTGVDLLRTTRERGEDLPFLLFTDEPLEEVLDEALAYVRSGYVSKDDDGAALVEQFEALTTTFSPHQWSESEQRYRHLVTTSPAPINLFDATGEIVWGNGAVLDLLGLESHDALVGRSIFDFIHTDDRETAESELAAVIEKRRATGPTDMKLTRADGETRYIQVSTAPGEYRGRPIGQAVIVDITPLKRTTERLRDEQRFIEQALDAIKDAFYLLDTDREIVRWNQAALDVTGYTEEEFASMGIPDLVVEEDERRVRDSITTVIERGHDDVEARVETRDGRTVPHEFRGRRLTNAAGEVVGIVGIARDISTQRERERHLHVLDQFLRHNIRTDLNVIMGVAQLIQQDDLEDPTTATEMIRGRSEHLLAQMEKQRDVVRLLTTQPSRGPIALGSLVQELTEKLGGRHPDARFTVSDSDGGRAFAVPAIRDAVRELLENAVVHSDREIPVVDVVITEGEGKVTLRIADNGPGIPEMERDVLRESFEIDQLHHGTGMGLWYAYWAVQRSNGSVTFDENTPRGSVITVVLPAVSTPDE